jgi:hypothetical protein
VPSGTKQPYRIAECIIHFEVGSLVLVTRSFSESSAALPSDLVTPFRAGWGVLLIASIFVTVWDGSHKDLAKTDCSEVVFRGSLDLPIVFLLTESTSEINNRGHRPEIKTRLLTLQVPSTALFRVCILCQTVYLTGILASHVIQLLLFFRRGQKWW